MPVPVSLRPDRRGQVRHPRRGWITIEETREHQREQQRKESQRDHWEERVRQHRIAAGMGLLFGGDEGDLG